MQTAKHTDQTASAVLPTAFGLAGIHLHPYSGWRSVTYWNAYVANTQLYGLGTFYEEVVEYYA
jgi:hypothetical protein